MVSRRISLFVLFLAAATLLSAQLTTDDNQVWWQDDPDIIGNAEGNDRFGHDLATGDFNGDGIQDLVIGVPGEDGARGVVQVIYGSTGGPTAEGNQVWGQQDNGLEGDAEQGDTFGITVATGDFNGDGFDDLAAGVPGEDGNSGVVHVVYGSAAGLTASGAQVWAQGGDILGGNERGDNFGTDVTTGDFNGDGFDDLAVGVPGESNAGGLVNIIYGSSTGLTSNGNQRLRQDADGIRGSRENGDLFGLVVQAGNFNGDAFADLAIGVPGEDGGEGRVDVVYGFSGGLAGNSHQEWTQNNIFGNGNSENRDAFGTAMAAGDFNGDGFQDLAIAAQGENDSRGDVTVIYGSPSGLQGAGARQLRQAENGVGGDRQEDGDVFGSALAAGDFELDGFDDLAIGVRGEDGNIGLVHMLPGSANGIDTSREQILAQGFEGLQDQAESRDDFGFSLAAGDAGADFADELIIGAPGEDNDRGIVHVLFGVESNPRPVLSDVLGAGNSLPPVSATSYNAILSLFGDRFAPEGLFRVISGQDLVNGRVPTMVDGFCVEAAGRRMPLFGIFDTEGGDQINFQADVRPGDQQLSFEVIIDCGGPNERRSNPVNVPVRAATPEFFFFSFSQNGIDPVAAIDAQSFELIGPPSLGGQFRVARVGDIVTVFFNGGGETSPRFAPGELPAVAGRTVLMPRIFLGGVEVMPIYVGVTGGNAGLYQASFEIPANAATGNLALRIELSGPEGTFTTPAGGFLPVGP